MARHSNSQSNDNDILKQIYPDYVNTGGREVSNDGAPLGVMESPAVSKEAKENINKAEEKEKKIVEESKPGDDSIIDHPDYVGQETFDVDENFNYETSDSVDATKEDLTDYYDPDDVINADIGDYVLQTTPKITEAKQQQIEEESLQTPAEIKKVSTSGLYIKTGEGTYFYNKSNGIAGTYIRKFVTGLETYLKNNVSGFLGTSSLGITRTLESTLEGGTDRSSTSKHGAGLAMDVCMNTIKLNTSLNQPLTSTNTFSVTGKYGYTTCDPILAKDTALTNAIRKFLENQKDEKGRIYGNVIKWGGDFKQTKPADKAAGVRIMEYHHFEIQDQFMKEFFEPIAPSLAELDLKVPSSQNQLKPIYEKYKYV